MDWIQEAEPIKVHGAVVASYGSDDPALGCPVEYINLKGSSYDNPKARPPRCCILPRRRRRPAAAPPGCAVRAARRRQRTRARGRLFLCSGFAPAAPDPLPSLRAAAAPLAARSRACPSAVARAPARPDCHTNNTGLQVHRQQVLQRRLARGALRKGTLSDGGGRARRGRAGQRGTAGLSAANPPACAPSLPSLRGGPLSRPSAYCNLDPLTVVQQRVQTGSGRGAGKGCRFRWGRRRAPSPSGLPLPCGLQPPRAPTSSAHTHTRSPRGSIVSAQRIIRAIGESSRPPTRLRFPSSSFQFSRAPALRVRPPPRLPRASSRNMAARRLIPLLDRVLVEKIVAPTKTASGILLPESATPKARARGRSSARARTRRVPRSARAAPAHALPAADAATPRTAARRRHGGGTAGGSGGAPHRPLAAPIAARRGGRRRRRDRMLVHCAVVCAQRRRGAGSRLARRASGGRPLVARSLPHTHTFAHRLPPSLPPRHPTSRARMRCADQRGPGAGGGPGAAQPGGGGRAALR